MAPHPDHRHGASRARLGSGSLARRRPLPSSAYVTGATGGLGTAIARHLTSLGCQVTVSGRDADALDRLTFQGVGAEASLVDLTGADAVEALVAEAEGHDAVVLNAGAAGVGPAALADPREIAAELAVNLEVPALVAARLAARWHDRPDASIVVVSSLSARNWRPGMATYAASKAGIRAFAWCLRQEVGPDGPHIGIVTPGPIRGAGMFARIAADAPDWWPTRAPADVAEAVERSLRTGRGEITVAPLILRAWAAAAAAAPAANAGINAAIGAGALLERFTGSDPGSASPVGPS